MAMGHLNIPGLGYGTNLPKLSSTLAPVSPAGAELTTSLRGRLDAAVAAGTVKYVGTAAIAEQKAPSAPGSSSTRRGLSATSAGYKRRSSLLSALIGRRTPSANRQLGTANA